MRKAMFYLRGTMVLYKHKGPSESTSTVPGYDYTISVLLHLLLGQDDFWGFRIQGFYSLGLIFLCCLEIG